MAEDTPGFDVMQTCDQCGASTLGQAATDLHAKFHDDLHDLECTVSNLDAEANAGDPDY